MRELKIGECIHNHNGICSCGKYQNYLCSYKNDINICPCSHAITEEIKRQYEEKGYFIIPADTLKYNPFNTRPRTPVETDAPRQTLTVYAIDASGKCSRVAGYEAKRALQVVNDETIKNITHAVELVAIDKENNIVARSKKQNDLY